MSSYPQDAACRGMDPAIFYPMRGSAVKVPKAICNGCSVKAECLAAAMAEPERYGIWGDATERERRAMRYALAPSTGRARRLDEAVTMNAAGWGRREAAAALGVNVGTYMRYLKDAS